MTHSLVSVLIPTHNRAHYLGEAIHSVLCQTLDNLEIVVVDDGSTDHTATLLSSIEDPRLRVVRHERNRGIPAARNTALDHARGQYLAWLDSDDLARPTRLAEQITYLKRHPHIAMVGACAGKLTPNGVRRRGRRVPPLAPELIGAWLLFRSAFQQSAVTGRADVLRNHRYDPAFAVCEDLDVFQRLHRNGQKMVNLPRVLIDRRVHPNQTVRLFASAIRDCKVILSAPMLMQLGVNASEEDLKRHVLLGKVDLSSAEVPSDFLPWTRAWMRKLRAANRVSGKLDEASLALATDYFWVVACHVASRSLKRGDAVRALAAAPPFRLIRAPAIGWLRSLVVMST